MPESQEAEDTEEVEEEYAKDVKEEKKSTANTDDQESYKREFFAMLEDVIKLSSDFPSVLLDPEFHLCGDAQKS